MAPASHTTEALERGLAHHRRGELAAAAAAYQELLANEPAHADALRLLGVAFLQRGEIAAACEALDRAVRAAPGDALALAQRAEARRAAGDLAAAEGDARAAIAADPTLASAHNHLGNALLAAGRAEEAAAAFRSSLARDGNSAAAANNLGNALRETGDLDGARAAYERAVGRDPQLPAARSNLGQLLVEAGYAADALVHLERAAALAPESAAVWNNLGNARRELGRLADARAAYGRALQLDPGAALTQANIGQALQEEGRETEAAAAYRRALELDPTLTRTRVHLASALEALGELAAARAGIAEVLAATPDSLDALLAAARQARDDERPADAEALLDRAAAAQPRRPEPWTARAGLLVELGRLDEAEQAVQQALQRRPGAAAALRELAVIRRGRLADGDAAILEGALARAAGREREPLLFALAQVRDARDERAGAAAALAEANALRGARRHRAGQSHDPVAARTLVEDLVATFDARRFADLRGTGEGSDPSALPIFVVGLPRSGTTLTEQMLAAHPQVHGAGELRLLRESVKSLAAAADDERTGRGGEGHGTGGSPRGAAGASLDRVRQWLPHLDRSHVPAVAAEHLAALTRRGGAARRVVDKMPGNTLWLGFVPVLFPNARIVLCRRDPRDVALSCWKTDFRRIDWADDPLLMASHFADVARIVGHWRALGIPMLELDYERTVGEPEATARALVDWVGLEWDPACARPSELDRPIRTASATQVRQPVYTTSVRGWEKWQPWLGGLFDRLPDAI